MKTKECPGSKLSCRQCHRLRGKRRKSLGFRARRRSLRHRRRVHMASGMAQGARLAQHDREHHREMTAACGLSMRRRESRLIQPLTAARSCFRQRRSGESLLVRAREHC